MLRRGLGLGFVAALVMSSCGEPKRDPVVPTSAPGCRIRVPESQDNPFIVEWDEARRRVLRERMKSGVVVVRYDDCNLEVLERCSAANAKYLWRTTAPKRDRISISNVEQLWANVPTGAAKLEEDLGGGELTIDAMRVGTWYVPEAVPQASLQGNDCARATHVIAAISTGAFEMRKRISVLAKDISEGPDGVRAPVTHEGKFDACGSGATESGPPNECAAPIRIEVTKIIATAQLCRAGDRVDCAQQCKNGNEQSCQRLADVLPTEDDPERTTLYRKACERGDQRSCNNFGVMLVRGVAVAHDLPHARQLFVKACDSGLVEACSNAGVALSRDVYMKPLLDPEAEPRLRQACAKNLAVACFEAGNRMAEDGKTFAAHDAVQLVTKACELDYGPACAKLAEIKRPTERAAADKLDAKACAKGVRTSCPKGEAPPDANDGPWSELFILRAP